MTQETALPGGHELTHVERQKGQGAWAVASGPASWSGVWKEKGWWVRDGKVWVEAGTCTNESGHRAYRCLNPRLVPPPREHPPCKRHQTVKCANRLTGGWQRAFVTSHPGTRGWVRERSSQRGREGVYGAGGQMTSWTPIYQGRSCNCPLWVSSPSATETPDYPSRGYS